MTHLFSSIPFLSAFYWLDTWRWIKHSRSGRMHLNDLKRSRSNRLDEKFMPCLRSSGLLMEMRLLCWPLTSARRLNSFDASGWRGRPMQMANRRECSEYPMMTALHSLFVWRIDRVGDRLTLACIYSLSRKFWWNGTEPN